MVRVDADREIAEDILADVRLDLAESLEASREHVLIGDDDEGVVRVLKRHAVLQRSDEVAEVERASRPIASEQAGTTAIVRIRVDAHGCLVSHRSAQPTGRQVFTRGTTDLGGNWMPRSPSRDAVDRLCPRAGMPPDHLFAVGAELDR